MLAWVSGPKHFPAWSMSCPFIVGRIYWNILEINFDVDIKAFFFLNSVEIPIPFENWIVQSPWIWWQTLIVQTENRVKYMSTYVAIKVGSKCYVLGMYHMKGVLRFQNAVSYGIVCSMSCWRLLAHWWFTSPSYILTSP